MSQQYPEMFQDYPTNRSPGSTRGYNSLALNRQPSRHFDYNAAPQSSLPMYNPAEQEQRYDPPRYTAMASSTLHSNYGYDNQTWNYANGGANTMGGTGRIKPQSRRAALPTPWMDSQPQQQMPPPQMQSPMPNLPHSQQMNGHYSQPHMLGHQQRASPTNDEELIPTAIVIKNIPFAVKKEELSQVMLENGLPLPYAFNYHFDVGVFRGLAFANFTTPEETEIVINRLNHFEIQGRKLRVEYKKMLPAAERDRIERDKREKRGQLQEQHQPMAHSILPLRNQGSMNSLNSGGIPATSPSPLSNRGNSNLLSQTEIDLNQPDTLDFYTKLVAFKSTPESEAYIFPPDITPAQRRTIHTLAHHMGLEHRSEGTGDMRQVQILKRLPNISPPLQQNTGSLYNSNESRRGLARAATIDFNEARQSDAGYYHHTLNRHASDLLHIPGSPGLSALSAHNHNNLRAAKSFADLRSYTPSPVPSTASFPVGLSQNVSRYAEYAQGNSSAASGTPNLTPTSGRENQMSNREDAFLMNGISSMSISSRSNVGGRLGQERENYTSSAGPIGSQRPGNGGYEENPRNGASAVPERQPRGPGAEWGSGFQRPRQNGHVNRGSGELDLNNVDKAWDDNRAQDSSDRNGPPSRYM